jgi:CheY-like chemotaxis protein
MRILIVEDSALVRGMYGLAFSPREHELTTAAEGREALARLSESTFDVVLLDLRMPGMNGVEFLREVRRRSFGTWSRRSSGNHRNLRPDGAESRGFITQQRPLVRRDPRLAVGAVGRFRWAL